MKTFNKVILLGIVNKPLLADEANNKPLKFTLVTKKDGYTRQDGTVIPEEPQFHDCVCFGKLGITISKYIMQGDTIQVEGELAYNVYTDKNNVTRKQTNIVVSNIILIHHCQSVQQTMQSPQQQFANQMPQPGQIPQYQQPYQQQYQQQQKQYKQQSQYQPPVQSNGGNPPF